MQTYAKQINQDQDYVYQQKVQQVVDQAQTIIRWLHLEANPYQYHDPLITIQVSPPWIEHQETSIWLNHFDEQFQDTLVFYHSPIGQISEVFRRGTWLQYLAKIHAKAIKIETQVLSDLIAQSKFNHTPINDASFFANVKL